MDIERMIDQAINLLRSQDASTRERAAETLGRIGSSRAGQALLNTLVDKNSRVRQRAAWAIGQIFTQSSIDSYFASNHNALFSALGSEKEFQLLREIALGRKAPPPSSEPPEAPLSLPTAPPAPAGRRK